MDESVTVSVDGAIVVTGTLGRRSVKMSALGARSVKVSALGVRSIKLGALVVLLALNLPCTLASRESFILTLVRLWVARIGKSRK